MLENQRNDETENRYLQLCLGCKFCTAEYALVKPAVRCVGMNLKIFVSYQTYFPKQKEKNPTRLGHSELFFEMPELLNMNV